MSNSKSEIIRNIKLLQTENSRRNHTHQYDAAQKFLIIRRGNPFKIKIYLGKRLKQIEDKIYLLFQVYDDTKAEEKLGTLIRLRITDTQKHKEYTHKWEMTIFKTKNKILTVNIKPAADCPVAKWKVMIQRRLHSHFEIIYKLNDPIYILFNPWCIDDDVFIEDESHIEEYVLTTTTFIWRGTTYSNRPMLWYLGQYERNILDCAMYLVERVANVEPYLRGSPQTIARALSAAVNAPDDDGVLVGSWGNYVNGTDPNRWTGSVEIIQSYYESEKPIKYAQCWVFAGVLSTIARALGMPSRIVTNFNSGHDTLGSLLVDEIYSRTGKRIHKLSRDFFWNFHTWNEVWMKRPDINKNQLQQDFNGWQAVDPTPSETSTGVYCLGPASVKAVKMGEVSKPFDSNYVYAAVNADLITWEYRGRSLPLKILSVDTEYIGKMISTKAVGKWERNDITLSYKFPEKTEEERNIMSRALNKSEHPYAKMYLHHLKHITVKLISGKKQFIGDPFLVDISIQNVSKNKFYTITGSLNVVCDVNTRKQKDSLKQRYFSINIGPEQTKTVQMKVAFEDYYPKLTDQAMFNVSSFVAVKNTNFEYFVKENIKLLKPDIQFDISNLVTLNQPIVVSVSLKNPLPITLHKGIFLITGSTIRDPLILKVGEVKPGETTQKSFKYTPIISGKEILAAKFTSMELQDIDGHVVLEIPQESNLRSPSVVSLPDLFSTDFH